MKGQFTSQGAFAAQEERFSRNRVSVLWRVSRSMVATRNPAFTRAMAMWMEKRRFAGTAFFIGNYDDMRAAQVRSLELSGSDISVARSSAHLGVQTKKGTRDVCLPHPSRLTPATSLTVFAGERNALRQAHLPQSKKPSAASAILVRDRPILARADTPAFTEASRTFLAADFNGQARDFRASIKLVASAPSFRWTKAQISCAHFGAGRTR